jgi:hypothetical protein
VQIGMDKTIKLSEVFRRYADFCNEQYPSQKVEVSELEFFHAQLLAGHDTAEVAALMKNDRISVRREQSKDRADEEAWNRLQRDSDQQFFHQLRNMLPNAQETTPSTVAYDLADIVLDCRRVLYPNSNKTIKCHSVMICRRCPWLGRMILTARQELAGRIVDTGTFDEAKDMEMDDERDFELMQHLKVEPRVQPSAAAQIENDDEDLDEDCISSERLLRSSDIRMSSGYDDELTSLGSPLTQQPQPLSNVVSIVIENHPAEAMKILLEYCYSNRVENLGYEAFMYSCKTKPQYKKLQGPVPPFNLRPSRWPNSGEPTILFDVALAGIRLAEEAELPRLSLMCEIAAAQLVDHSNIVDALAACEQQRQLTGNALPRLRKATMDIVLVLFQLGNDNETTACLRKALSDKTALLVPTLITGTMEAVDAGEKRMRQINISTISTPDKRDWQSVAYRYFGEIDKIETMERDRERRKRRAGVEYGDDYTEPMDDMYSYHCSSNGAFDHDELFPFWGESGVRRMSLKRMQAHQINGTASSLMLDHSMVVPSNYLLHRGASHVASATKHNNPLLRRDFR